MHKLFSSHQSQLTLLEGQAFQNPVDFVNRLKMAIQADWFYVISNRETLDNHARHLALIELFTHVLTARYVIANPGGAGEQALFAFTTLGYEVNQALSACKEKLISEHQHDTLTYCGKALSDGEVQSMFLIDFGCKSSLL